MRRVLVLAVAGMLAALAMAPPTAAAAQAPNMKSTGDAPAGVRLPAVDAPVIKWKVPAGTIIGRAREFVPLSRLVLFVPTTWHLIATHSPTYSCDSVGHPDGLILRRKGKCTLILKTVDERTGQKVRAKRTFRVAPMLRQGQPPV